MHVWLHFNPPEYKYTRLDWEGKILSFLLPIHVDWGRLECSQGQSNTPSMFHLHVVLGLS